VEGIVLNFEDLKLYIMVYSAEGSSANDRVLVYDITTRQWVIWKIRANCIAVVESSESGQTVWKPWIGTVGGFVYKLLTGYNLGGPSGTVSGTVTAAGADNITDSNASFYTTDDGLKDLYVSIFNSDGDFVEEQKILSNTGTKITVDTNFGTQPSVGDTYEVGSIIWKWKSKVFDFGVNSMKRMRNVLMNFTKVSSERNVDVKIYVSMDPDMPTTEDQTITFDLSQDYYEPQGLYDNRCRFFQFEITGHGTNDEVTINNIAFDFLEYLK
jgi:hypothetical protein